jgi:DNA-binding GntR family transcriptional regulator
MYDVPKLTIEIGDLMADLAPVSRNNLSQLVYSELRGALMNGQYSPGERLRIADLAEGLGTSITPVREAIFRLVSEQALSMTAATSISVPELDLPTIREIQLMRVLLEGAAAEAATSRISDKEIEQLERMQEQFIKASASNPREGAKRNRQFHFQLMAAAKLPSLTVVVESLWVRMGPLLATFHAQVPKRNIYNDEHPHYRALQGLKSRNPNVVRQAMEEDIRWGERVLSEWLSGRSVDEIYASV